MNSRFSLPYGCAGHAQTILTAGRMDGSPMISSDDASPNLTETICGDDVLPAEIVGRANPPPESESPHSLPPRVIHLAAVRRRILSAVLPVLAEGGSQAEAAEAAGVAGSMLSKILKLGADGGRTALERCQTALALPLDRLAAVAPEKPSDWLPILDGPLGEELRSLYLSGLRASSEAMSHGRHTGSMSLALKLWAETPGMPDWAAARLAAGGQPIACRKFLRRITPALEQLVRGERKARLHGPTAQRDNTLRLSDGRRCRQLAGFRVVFDDMSVNQPFFTDVIEDGEVVDTILSRQGLYAMDEATWRWLGVELVARPREAYRAEDILRFVRRLLSIYGKFDCLVFEQGVWHARAIRGFRKTTSGDVEEVTYERPGMSEEERAVLTQGLEGIGIQVSYVTSARGKTIEGAFGHLQPVIAAHTRDFQNIGAHAGEFERAAKQLRRARSEVAHPGDLKFAPMEELANRVESALAWMNRQPKDCLGGVTPDAQWLADMQLRRLPSLAEWEEMFFLPEKRERVLRGGAIHFTRSLTGWPFSYRNGEVMAALGDGYRVQVAFDPCEVAAGAVIVNNEPPGSPRNQHNYALGQFICRADFELPAPRADVASLPAGHVALDDYYGVGTENDIGDRELRRQKAWHRTEFRALPKPGQPAVRISSARDGRGNAVEKGQPTQIPQPAPARRSTRPDLSEFADASDLLDDQPDNAPARRFSAPDLSEFADASALL